jgi:murein DD-endopeptidase MepM/ murein hydrolase activator NlpD
MEKKVGLKGQRYYRHSRCSWAAGAVLLIFAVPANMELLRDPPKKEMPSIEPTALVVELVLEKGETLSSVLSRLNLDRRTVHAIVERLSQFINPRAVRAGQALEVSFDPKGNTVMRVEYLLPGAVVRVEWTPKGWTAERKEVPSVREMRAIRGTLYSSLYFDGRKQGLTPTQILDLADIFQYDVDFFSDFRAGDLFSVVFEEIRYADGHAERGRILAAELTVDGRSVDAFYHLTDQGDAGYYDSGGQALRSAFLRAPVNYRRISSRYSHRRRHPISRTVRSHQAIDYAAAAGTPVVSIGQGRVSFAGWRAGYGKLVEIRHPNGYVTRYAHFSRIARGVRRGKHVAQGEVVGYVGQTGHATGPHLHFEILRGRQKINFLTMPIPRQHRLSDDEMARFSALRDERLALLTGDKIQLAHAGSITSTEW